MPSEPTLEELLDALVDACDLDRGTSEAPLVAAKEAIRARFAAVERERDDWCHTAAVRRDALMECWKLASGKPAHECISTDGVVDAVAQIRRQLEAAQPLRVAGAHPGAAEDPALERESAPAEGCGRCTTETGERSIDCADLGFPGSPGSGPNGCSCECHRG